MKIKNKVEFSFYDVKYSSKIKNHTRALVKLDCNRFEIAVRFNNKWIDEASYDIGIGGNITDEVLEFSTDINNK